ncbi:GNAT family N-acetyltransferase [Vibrio tapetis]|uniref:GCN5-related N-acetyltransferase n=1 Tax=Vibrio tapetis subsp. tapetis TaxID=1671868 RepID=A0A2N8ZLZ9_9VIBR|nr:GNAT family N-acetyltransferase [Vibrio tapetis]SON52925.1 GCN5-related N-acetyltransferase [Vibrio tapetis subsp. tapetis]
MKVPLEKVPLETERLILRQWKEEDKPGYAALNADSQVMRYFPALLSQAESDAQVDFIHSLIEANGFGFWAVELKSSGEFIGFVGLHKQLAPEIPNTPMIEIGWRLSSEYWGKGYAPEAAEKALAFAFDELNLEQVYAFTALPNLPSQRVMSKIGMVNIDQDFDNPKLPKGHQLERHCLFEITSSHWRVRNK